MLPLKYEGFVNLCEFTISYFLLIGKMIFTFQNIR